MSVPLAGFTTLRLLRGSTKVRIYEAQRDADGRRVLAKVFAIPDDAAEARVLHEFSLLRGLEIEGVVRAIGVERAGREMVLLLDYVPGRNLGQVAAGQPLSVARFLPWALRMAEILAEVHAHRIVHRDIKPSNILVESGSEAIVFADFGISVLLEGERSRLHDPDVVHGTLPYISPEQTGRTRREVDARSDLYGLGATFYELLTGRPPFEASNPLELVHAHLARTPKAPLELVPELPERLSAIVMRLLEKAPEHRYQSSHGLIADLRRVANALAAGEVPRFVLGQDDHSQVLQLPHQLYGRAHERELLEGELEQTVNDGSRRMVVVSGGLGLGKSALLEALETPLSRYGGYFALGQFDGRRDTPYGGVIQAMRNLLGQILTETEVQLDSWAARLGEQLGSIGGVLTQLVPELELILGQLEAPPELGLGERSNRLHLAFSRFVAGVCQVAPLVLALDDLHLADPATFELLAALEREGGGPLLIVASCRTEHENRVRVDELMTKLVEEGRPCRSVELTPLDQPALSSLLGDALAARAERVEPLASYVARKTGGRPLYVRQLLTYLDDEGLLRLEAGGWTWNIDALARASVPDDLLALLAVRLERVERCNYEVLELAACVGEEFEPKHLPVDETLGLTPLQAFTALHALEREGLLDTIGTQFCFGHAQLRALVHERMEPSSRRRAHTAIGRRLLAGAGGLDGLARVSGATLFEVVEHLDEGLDPSQEQGEDARGELVALNLLAGERALNDAAWSSAQRYYSLATTLLGEGSLRDRDHFRAHFGLAQTLYLSDEFARADAIFEALLAAEPGLEELTAVTARRIDILTHRRRTRRATELGVEALRKCGLDVPAHFDIPALTRKVYGLVRELTLDELEQLPPMRDERVLAMMRVLGPFHTISFTVDRSLYFYLITVHLELIVEHGFHISVTDALNTIGFAMLGMRDFSEARRVSELSLEIADRRAASRAERHRADRGWLIFVGPCFHPFAEFARMIEPAHDFSVERGERTDAAFKAAIGLVLQFEAGRHLAEVGRMVLRFHAAHEDWANTDITAIAGGAIWFQAELSGASLELPPGAAPLPQPAGWDEDHIARLIRYGAVVTRAWAALLLGQHEQAWALSERIAADFPEVMYGNWTVPRQTVVDAIVASEQAQREPEADLEAVRARIAARREEAARWAERGPENFRANVDLIEGELALLDGDVAEAMQCYERACADASKHHRTWVEALACLRIAALAERSSWGTVAHGALTRALRAFERWGAWAAVEVVRARLGLVPQQAESAKEPTRDTSEAGMLAIGLHDPRRSTSGTGAGDAMPSLDLVAVLDTVRSIGEDLRLEEVIRRVLASATESAGADRGLLLLDRGGELQLVAESKQGETETFFDRALSFTESRERLPSTAIYYVVRTGTALVVDDVRADLRFSGDPYVQTEGIRSLLCMPIIKQGVRVGALVLENRLDSAFTEARLETSRLLLAQAASAIDNARLYAELARSEAQWRSLVDGAPDIITVLDEQGQIEFINHFDSYDFTPESLLGSAGDELFEPDSAERWRHALRAVLFDGASRELEVCVAPSGAPRRYYLIRLAAVRVDGRLRRVLSIARDLTERKRFEAQQRQQQRLESLGTLAAGVAHEINNPVQGIMNYSELIVDCVDDHQTVLSFAKEITGEAERVGTIVRQLLLFARSDREQVESARELVDVRELIESTLTLVRSVMRRDQVQLEVDIAEGLPPVPCRPQQIRQIIMNLVTNARDALNERFREERGAKWISIEAERFEGEGGEWVRISVADSGGGIPDDVRGQIFDPFFTTKARGEGTGLGLAVSHGIAQDHGGELRVEVEMGEGSRFSLELPAF